ncbi:DNA translocase FtsK [Rhizobium sp. SL42]|uniref:DNA translocase FtsK n=1 Tax=Rhizobium sp. SL42 TaxID=2806346 RepID=UPI001F24113F|nr:DNA translocase FtsK [Rhizobium sp. SL42]UJW75662.1 DNA translocase FtsK [Rhizobium sp. SL42]
MHPPRQNSVFSANTLGEKPTTKAPASGPAAVQATAVPGQISQGQTSQGGPRAGTDQLAASQIEGRSEMPAWQTAFVLGPNVRFTRTPDKTPNQAQTQLPGQIPGQTSGQRGEPETVEPLVAATVPATVTPPLAKPTVAAPRAPASVTLPQPPDAVGARALTYKLRRELARQQAELAAWAESQGQEMPMIAAQAHSPVPAAAPTTAMQVSQVVQASQAVQANIVPAPRAMMPSRIAASAPNEPRVEQPTMVRNAFLRGPVQAQQQQQQHQQPQQNAALATAATSTGAQTKAMTAHAIAATRASESPASAVQVSATQVPASMDVPAQTQHAAAPGRAPLDLSILLSDHIFFEAMIDVGEAPIEALAVSKPPVAPAIGAPALAPLPAPHMNPGVSAVRSAIHTPTPAQPPVRSRIAARAEVVRYRPDVAVQPQNAQTVRPVFDAPDGSVIALYRQVEARMPIVFGDAQAMVEAVPALSEGASPLQSPPSSAPQPFTSSLPIAQALKARQPLFREQPALAEGEYELPPIDLLQEAQVLDAPAMSPEALEQSAGLLENVLEDFGIKGEVIDVRPGPVVTLYEFEPAPGVKSSRVIGLSDDIARSMSALSARVAVVPGRNVIGIELPNPVRETVYLRELIETADYAETRFKLPVCLGKTIGGEPVIAELAKMPHLLVAGTTGSGKSVAINTMILSLLYRLRPEECRLIMVDPKMLELSVYDGIPHLLTPVVTDPKKAVMALKWAVREMEDRYRKMSRLGVRNIDGYNSRAAAARAKGETILCSVQTGFDRSTGEPTYEQEEMDLAAMPYIVVIVDEMADLMMVAGKEIEGAIQRLAQMARAAGIHLIMATQRPSVDVITGTIKANFPTRVSFQVTSKIDSRTILGEPGAEHLLGQGDMLHMVGGGRIARVHGPFVSDEEVEKVVAHLKTQGRPEYLGTVTEDADEMDETAEEDGAVFDKSAMGEEDASDLYDKAVKVVLRDKKCSTSYIQRRLSIGYNKAASLVERMEQEGLVGPANHVGKRSIIAGGREISPLPDSDIEG